LVENNERSTALLWVITNNFGKIRKYRIQISCIQISCTSKMNVVNTQLEPTTVRMSDQCKGAVARGLY